MCILDTGIGLEDFYTEGEFPGLGLDCQSKPCTAFGVSSNAGSYLLFRSFPLCVYLPLTAALSPDPRHMALQENCVENVKFRECHIPADRNGNSSEFRIKDS